MQTDKFQGRLLKGEKIVWWGQPAQGLLFTSKDWFLVPFSLMFAGFAVVWESGVLNATNSCASAVRDRQQVPPVIAVLAIPGG